jgi:mRNA-degrading endonuclease RelE of RelBE toxin-antitoxin system
MRKKALKFLEKLPKTELKRILKSIDEIESNPYTSKPLQRKTSRK